MFYFDFRNPIIFELKKMLVLIYNTKHQVSVIHNSTSCFLIKKGLFPNIILYCILFVGVVFHKETVVKQVTLLRQRAVNRLIN